MKRTGYLKKRPPSAISLILKATAISLKKYPPLLVIGIQTIWIFDHYEGFHINELEC